MLLLLRLVFVLASVPPVLSAILLFMAIESEPSIRQEWALTDQDIDRAKHIFEGNAVDNNLKTVELNSRDLNIALNYLLDNYLPSSSLVTLNDQAITFGISLTLPKNLIGHYLNLSFELVRRNEGIEIQTLKIGRVAVADELAGLLIDKTIKYAHFRQHYILVTEQIIDFDFDAEKLSLTYFVDPAYIGNTVDLLHRARDRQIMLYYQRKLTEIIDRHDPEWRLSLAELFQPLFELAYRRSKPNTAIKENRIVIFTVNSYVNRRENLPYLPGNVTARPHRNFPVFLYKRIDLAKHFIASATLTATGGGHLANLIGQEKELSDARSGSGFSFIDLAGDRAGMRFGYMAVSSPENARNLQKYMSRIKDYTAFMPDMSDLPENLTRKQFKKQFFSVYTPMYQQMLQTIDERIDALPLYKTRNDE